jgi:hypothetical protein
MPNESKEIRKLKQAKGVQGENEMLKSETLNLFQGMVQTL